MRHTPRQVSARTASLAAAPGTRPRHDDYVQPRRYRPGAGHVIAGGECRLSDFVLDIVPVAVTGRACDHLADESCKEQHDAKHDGEKRQIE